MKVDCKRYLLWSVYQLKMSWGKFIATAGLFGAYEIKCAALMGGMLKKARYR